MSECRWLPEIIECKDLSKWNEYLDKLYEVFCNDFVERELLFEGKKVNYRKAPKDGKYEHAFIHLTHENVLHASDNPNDRVPDLRRAERIGWNRPIIENYRCQENCELCDGVLYYEQMYKKNVRAYLLFKDVKFLVVLEKRESYILLITGYYLDYDNALEKHIKKFEKYEKQKTPLT